MQLNNTSQYAIRILIYIANNAQERLCSAKELSEQLTIPYKFMTKIMAELVKAGFIESIKGREGGYRLLQSSSSIRILDILNAFNECDNDDKCLLGIGACDSNNKCALHDQWVTPKEMIQTMYENTTLDQFEDKQFKI